MPAAYTTGTMHMYNPKSAWWNHAIVGNYAARFYKYAMKPVRELQKALEHQLSGSAKGLEETVTGMMHIPTFDDLFYYDDDDSADAEPTGSVDGSVDVSIPVPDAPEIPDGKGPPEPPAMPDLPSGSADISFSDSKKGSKSSEVDVRKLHRSLSSSQLSEIVDMITHYTVEQGKVVSASWSDIFGVIVSQYRDGYILDTSTATIGVTKMFYPQWWLESVGYYNTIPNKDPSIYFAPKSYPISYLSLSLIVGLFGLAVAMAGYALGHKAGTNKFLMADGSEEELGAGRSYQATVTPKYVEIPTTSHRVQKGSTRGGYAAINGNNVSEETALSLNI
jgi:hypothetical protein